MVPVIKRAGCRSIIDRCVRLASLSAHDAAPPRGRVGLRNVERNLRSLHRIRHDDEPLCFVPAPPRVVLGRAADGWRLAASFPLGSRCRRGAGARRRPWAFVLVRSRLRRAFRDRGRHRLTSVVEAWFAQRPGRDGSGLVPIPPTSISASGHAPRVTTGWFEDVRVRFLPDASAVALPRERFLQPYLDHPVGVWTTACHFDLG